MMSDRQGHRRESRMPTLQVDIHDPQTDLAGLVALVAAGTVVILTRGQTPVARILLRVRNRHEIAQA